MFRSYGGPTHRNVTSPRDRKMTSHHYCPRRTPLPSPTADPAPEALLTHSQFPTLSRQFIATIGTFEATRFFMFKLLRTEIKNQHVTIGVCRMSCNYSVSKIPALITIMDYIQIFPFRNISCNIILPSTPRFPTWTHHFRFSNYNSQSFSYLICYMPSHKILLLTTE